MNLARRWLAAFRSRSWLQLAVLLIATSAAFYPSLFQIPRSDQLVYLYQTAGDTSLWGLTGALYAFNRIINADVILFRPVLYALLGAERWAFGYHFALWQVVDLALHFATVASLYCYCARLLPSRTLLPFGLTGLLALGYAGCELIAWQNLSGYDLFALLLVQILLLCDTLMARPRIRSGVALIAITAIAAFTYELGCVLAPLVAGYLVLSRSRAPNGRKLRWTIAGGLVAVSVLYVALSLGDFWVRFGGLPALPPHSDPLWRAVPGFVFATGYWTLASVFPALLHLQLAPSGRVVLHSIVPTNYVVLAANAAAIAAIVFAIWRAAHDSVARREVRSSVPSLILIALLAGAYGAIIVRGRLVQFGIVSMVADSSYYTYTFTLLLVMALAHLLRPLLTPACGRLRNGAVIALMVISVIGGIKIWILGEQLATWSSPSLALVSAIEATRAGHPGKADFTFSLKGRCPGNQRLPWFTTSFHGTAQHPVSPDHVYTLAEVLFPRSYRDNGGEYVITCPR